MAIYLTFNSHIQTLIATKFLTPEVFYRLTFLELYKNFQREFPYRFQSQSNTAMYKDLGILDVVCVIKLI